MKMKIYQSIICIAFLLGSLSLYSQENPRIRKSEFKKEKEGLKEAWKSVRSGNNYYSNGIGTMRLARKYYLDAYEYNSENPELNYKIGVCYLFSDTKYESINYLKKAYGLNQDVTDDIHYMIARAYHLILDFDNAIAHYELYKKNKLSADMASKVNKHIEECHNGKELVESPVRVIIGNLGDKINSVYDDYNPVLTKDEKIMYFTSRRPVSYKSDRSIIDNKFFEDVYKSVNIDGEWQTAERIPSKKINGKKNKDNTAISGVSADAKTLYIYLGNKKGGEVYYTKQKEGKWKSPDRLPGKLSSGEKETTVTFSSNGKTMYLCSSNEKLTTGGLDILVSKIDSKGKWSNPKNLSPLLNTQYDEIGVFLTRNDSTMFFSSKGHNTMGGYDIFVSHLDETGVWSKPKNIGYPINTADDDIFYSLSENEKYAYYSTIRERGIGSRDIYKVTFLGSEKEPVIAQEPNLIAGMNRELPGIFFIPPEPVLIDNSILMQGKVLDASSQTPVVAKMELIDMEKNTVIATAMSSSDGSYKVKLPEKKTYGIEIAASDYLLFLDAVDVGGSDELIVKDFELNKVEVGLKIVLEKIFFETGKATLKPESHEQLSQIKKILEANPAIRIEISGHTDNVGSLRINTKLSTDRAKAVADYLVDLGIDKSRIEYKGYAYNQPIAPNNTAAGRQQNRRVEFKILGK
jgi:outer membrane protein OmpA-like peptidoglycan-associated protein